MVIPFDLWAVSPVVALLAALVYVLVWLMRSVSSGRFIPKASHDREIAIYVGIVENKDKTILAQQEQITSLLEVGKTVQAVLRSAGPHIEDETMGGA